jgi:signal transduction histidine kinase
MALSAKLQAFVRDLDPQTLEDLRQSVTAEIEGRHEETSFRVEDIHARMSPADKALAASEIARVLRERN